MYFTIKKRLPLFTKLACYSAVSLLILSSSHAATDAELIQKQLHREQEQQKAREKQLGPKVSDVRLEVETEPTNELNFPVEKPCFNIGEVEVFNLYSMPKWLGLQYIAAKANNRCLGNQGINLLMGTLQNRLIEHGYVTSRILAPEQDLRAGFLHLLVLPGSIRQITSTTESDSYISFFNTIPMQEGGLLNLRDIEQGLENLQRIPTAYAEINLMPGDKPGQSDVVVTWKQDKFWRIGASFDDSGTISTGRYQGGLTLYLDNPTSLGDMFYISGGHDSRGSNEKGSRNYTMSYSVPFGYWSFSTTLNGNKYHQTVFAPAHNYEYSGRSRSISARLSRIIHRDTNHKTTLFYEVLRRNSQNYLDDAELELQRRNTSFWKLGLQHRQYFTYATFDGTLDYQRGTRWFGSQPAPEEEIDDGSALASIVHLSASLDVPFTLLGQKFSYSPSYRQQFSKTKLTSQDRFSIGGRWSVRGFDGELSLSADDGWYVRNDLNWVTPLPSQQLYIGIDHGEVKGEHSDMQVGQHLTGAVVGLKGNIPKVNISYDVFAGKPISKPKGFETSNQTYGFNLYWEY